MYRQLLVPFDGSPFSASALPIAAALAKRTGATLHLVLVHDPSSYIPFVAGEVAVPIFDAELVREQHTIDLRALQTEAATLTAEGLTVATHLVEGTTVDALVECGAAVGADLTVMTTHGRGGFKRLQLGSVATAYLTAATTPVLLLSARERADGKAEVPTTLPTGAVLCPLDGSAWSESALPHARTLADVLGTAMTLLTVSVPHSMPVAPPGTELLIDPDALDTETREQERYLIGLLDRCPPESTTRAVSGLTAAREILEEAAHSGAGVIAMATHGRGGIMRLILGSVADEVIRHADIPVLVFHPVGASKNSGDNHGASA
jgi:nucleotide-binding universal stress UspA family protein